MLSCPSPTLEITLFTDGPIPTERRQRFAFNVIMPLFSGTCRTLSYEKSQQEFEPASDDSQTGSSTGEGTGRTGLSPQIGRRGVENSRSSDADRARGVERLGRMGENGQEGRRRINKTR